MVVWGASLRFPFLLLTCLSFLLLCALTFLRGQALLSAVIHCFLFLFALALPHTRE